MTKHETVLELREQIKQWTNEMERLEEVIESAYHRIDELTEEIEQEGKQDFLVDGHYVAFDKEDLHKIISIVEHVVVPRDEDHPQETRVKIYNHIEEISWKIAEVFGYDLTKGTVDPITLKFEKFI